MKMRALTDYADVVGRGIAPAYTQGEGLVVLNQRCVRGGCVDLDVARSHDLEARQVAPRKLLQAGDIVVNSTGVGTLGRSARWSGSVAATADSHLTIVRPHEGTNSRWLSYAMRLLEPEIVAMAQGSTGQTELGREELGQLPIPEMGKVGQDAIGEVLGALDDKIAANRRVHETIDKVCAEVFVRSFALSKTDVLSSVASVNVQSVSPVPGGDLHYLDIGAVSEGDHVLPDAMSWERAPGRARRGLRWGDTIWSTVRPNRRSHTLNLDADPLLVASTGLAVLTPVQCGPAFLYEASKQPVFQHYLESVAEGSTYPAVRGDLFHRAPLPRASIRQRQNFEGVALPLREKQSAMRRENATLAKTLEELLPLLMSGKITVKDAEKRVQGVV